MRYPADFVKRVKAEFPNHQKLHLALDTGDEDVGGYLYQMLAETESSEIANVCRDKEGEETLSSPEIFWDEWARLYRKLCVQRETNRNLREIQKKFFVIVSMILGK